LIGVSNTMSCNIFKNWLFPNISSQKIILIGKIISILTMGLSLGIAVYIYQTGIEYGVLLVLQSSILWQAIPAYLFGLYTNIDKRSVLFGLIIGLISDIVLITAVFTDSNPIVEIDESLSTLDKSWSAFVGVLFNLIGCSIGHFCFRWKYDEKSNMILTINDIREIMKGISEPITRCYGAFIWLSVLCFIVTTFHMMGDIDPALIEEYGLETVRTFYYNGYVENVIVGLPFWVFATLMWFVIASICGIIAALTWNVDTEYKRTNVKSQSAMDKEAISMVSMDQMPFTTNVSSEDTEIDI